MIPAPPHCSGLEPLLQPFAFDAGTSLGLPGAHLLRGVAGFGRVLCVEALHPRRVHAGEREAGANGARAALVLNLGVGGSGSSRGRH